MTMTKSMAAVAGDLTDDQVGDAVHEWWDKGRGGTPSVCGPLQDAFSNASVASDRVFDIDDLRATELNRLDELTAAAMKPIRDRAMAEMREAMAAVAVQFAREYPGAPLRPVEEDVVREAPRLTDEDIRRLGAAEGERREAAARKVEARRRVIEARKALEGYIAAGGDSVVKLSRLEEEWAVAAVDLAWRYSFASRDFSDAFTGAEAVARHIWTEEGLTDEALDELLGPIHAEVKQVKKRTARRLVEALVCGTMGAARSGVAKPADPADYP